MTYPEAPPDAKTFDDMIWRLNGIAGEPRSSVLITHLYVEYLLDWMLRKKVPKPDYVLKQPFNSKLKLIQAFQILSDEIMNELFVVNEVRNQFAHRIDIESEDFQNELINKVKKMSFYKASPNLATIPIYNAYHMIMYRMYAVLKHEFDQL